jgi:glutathione S-transferase
MVLKVYAAYVSPPSRAVLLFLAENKIPHELKIVDIQKGEHMSESYAKINPAKQVPCIDDDGFILNESASILRYLGEKYAPTLYPNASTESKQRAFISSRMDWLNTDLYVELAYQFTLPQVLPHMKRDSDEVQKSVVERGKKNTEKWLSYLNDSILATNTFLAGNSMTVADFQGIGQVSLGELIGINYAKYPKVKAWMDKMKALPNYAEIFKMHEGFAASLKGKPMITIT